MTDEPPRDDHQRTSCQGVLVSEWGLREAYRIAERQVEAINDEIRGHEQQLAYLIRHAGNLQNALDRKIEEKQRRTALVRELAAALEHP